MDDGALVQVGAEVLPHLQPSAGEQTIQCTEKLVTACHMSQVLRPSSSLLSQPLSAASSCRGVLTSSQRMGALFRPMAMASTVATKYSYTWSVVVKPCRHLEAYQREGG